MSGPLDKFGVEFGTPSTSQKANCVIPASEHDRPQSREKKDAGELEEETVRLPFFIAGDLLSTV